MRPAPCAQRAALWRYLVRFRSVWKQGSLNQINPKSVLRFNRGREPNAEDEKRQKRRKHWSLPCMFLGTCRCSPCDRASPRDSVSALGSMTALAARAWGWGGSPPSGAGHLDGRGGNGRYRDGGAKCLQILATHSAEARSGAVKGSKRAQKTKRL